MNMGMIEICRASEVLWDIRFGHCHGSDGCCILFYKAALFIPEQTFEVLGNIQFSQVHRDAKGRFIVR